MTGLTTGVAHKGRTRVNGPPRPYVLVSTRRAAVT